MTNAIDHERWITNLPGFIAIGSAAILCAGVASSLAYWQTGHVWWVRAFFNYPAALFFLAAGSVQIWLSFRCWRQFSPGDVLRPAWLLIALSGVAQLTGTIVSKFLGLESHLNPLLWLPIPSRHVLTVELHDVGTLFSPAYMALLAAGLGYVLDACRRHGIRGRVAISDLLLQAVVVAYTVDFLATVVFAAGHGGRTPDLLSIVSWTSDPLLCVLLFQAILIRRSTSAMGLGLVSRCWLCFTTGIFVTSLGDIGLWAWSNGFLAHGFEAVSWNIWFIPAAAFAMGPAYQLQAMLRASSGDVADVAEELVAR